MITDYPMGSKCAGYTAPRKFTRATFRVDSNVTKYHSNSFPLFYLFISLSRSLTLILACLTHTTGQ
jgi:hypothetical protein